MRQMSVGRSTFLNRCVAVFSLGIVFACSPLESQSRFAYVTNQSSATVNVFSVDPSTGALTLTSVIGTDGFVPTSVVVDADHMLAFVGSNGRFGSALSAIMGFSVDATSGALTPLPRPILYIGSGGILGMTLHPSGKFLYAANAGTPGSILAFSINAQNGTLSTIPGTPVIDGPQQQPYSASLNPAGDHLFVANGDNMLVFRVDPTTGALTLPPGPRFSAFLGTTHFNVIDPTGRFLYLSSSANSLFGFRFDSVSDILTPVPDSPFPVGLDPLGLAVHPSGRFVYAVNAASNNLSGYSIDPNGSLHVVTGAPVPTGSDPIQLAVNPPGDFLYTVNFSSNNISGFTVNATTGALTSIPGSPFRSDSGPDWITIATLGSTVPADLTVSMTHAGTFVRGSSSNTYTIWAANIGAGSTSGSVTVNNNLQPGLTPLSLAGSGWTCDLATVSCTRSDALASGSSYPPITLTLQVSPYTAAYSFTDIATVSGGGEGNTANDTSSDTVTSLPAGSPTVPTTVATVPSGLKIVVDGVGYTAPHTFYNWQAGQMHTLSAPGPQVTPSQPAILYSFGAWSDGGPNSHNITVSPAQGAFTASFVGTPASH